MNIDYLIVGQGLAGSILAHRLLARNKKILVIDDGKLPSSSKIAAGLFNPVTGRKMVKTWNADLLFPSVFELYPELESLLQMRFFHPMTIYRPFRNAEEQNDWMGKSADPGMEKFIRVNHTQPAFPEHVKDGFGGLELNFSGYVDISTFQDNFREFLKNRGNLADENFDQRYLIINQNRIAYKQIVARHIIFCEGPFEAMDGLFNWLPFRPVKGELIEIETDISTDLIYNRGVFMIPLGDKKFKVGSSYDWRDLSWENTKEARQSIEQRLKTLFCREYQVIRQFAGIRPATQDRKPFLGMHPKFKNVLIFNGFGTKGVTLIPYFSKKLCEYLEDGIDLPEEANISRYFSLY